MSDVDELAKLICDGGPVNLKYTQWLNRTSRQDVEAAARTYIEEWAAPENNHRTWILTERATGSIAGIQSVRLERNVGVLDWSALIGVGFRGRGYGPEMLRHLIDWALAQPDLWRVQGVCDFANHAASRCMQRAGMKVEGVLGRFARMPNISSEPRDVLMYAAVR
jgi:RimJ/RimL family protein N-acetyltransferase